MIEETVLDLSLNYSKYLVKFGFLEAAESDCRFIAQSKEIRVDIFSDSVAILKSNLGLAKDAWRGMINNDSDAGSFSDALDQVAAAYDEAVGQFAILKQELGQEISDSFLVAVSSPAEIDRDGGINRPLFLGWGCSDEAMPFHDILQIDAALHKGEGSYIDADGSLAKTANYESHTAGLKANNSKYYIRTGWCEHEYQASPKWFMEKYGDDPDIFSRNCSGERGHPRGNVASLNINHPAVKELCEFWTENWAKAMEDEEQLLFSLYGAEPHWTSMGGGANEAGHSDASIAEYHIFLQENFADISALNADWSTEYQSFAEIAPSTDTTFETRETGSAEIVWFQKFRQYSFLELFKLHHSTYKKHAPEKPLILYGGGGISLFNGDLQTGMDVLEWFKADVGDVYGMHINTQWVNIPQSVYHYSLNRHFQKRLGQFEYVWSYPRHHYVETDDDYFAVGMGNTFRQLAWGKTMFVVFGHQFGNWSFYRHDFFEIDPASPLILRDAIRWIPIMKARAEKLFPIIEETRIVPAKIAIMQPSTALSNANPSTLPRLYAANLHDMLFKSNYPYFFLMEEHIMDGTESLDDYSALFLPYAISLADGLSDKLLSWIEQGGTLVMLMPAGVYDKYGNGDGQLLKTLFGDLGLTNAGDGQWVSADVNAGELKTVSYGKGSCSLALTHPWFIHDAIYELMSETVARDVWCDADRFELTLRENLDDGMYYLFVLNPHYKDRLADTIHIAASVESCTDTSLGLPLETQSEGDLTAMSIALGPGEGRVFALKLASSFVEKGLSSSSQDVAVYESKASHPEYFDSYSMLLGKGTVDEQACQDADDVIRHAFKDSRAPDLIIPKATEAVQLVYRESDWEDVRTIYLSEGDDQKAVENEYAAPAEKVLAENLGCFQVQWDDDYLYFLFNVNDEEIWNPYSGYLVWGGDVVDIFIDLTDQAPGDMTALAFHVQLTPTGDVVPHNWYNLPMPGIESHVTECPGSYILSCRIPYETSHIIPEDGFNFSLNIRMADVEPGGASAKGASWKSTAGLMRRPDRNVCGWGRVRLG
ncbi:MAG: beta-galactosidase [Lentisphaeria bacterium]|nr:beta-galactosidase [Lentisphaeria bacterium]NQZ70984.1 beta-galactosidase [Lentisphaeria bacterium]